MADEPGTQDQETDPRECVHFPMRVQQVGNRAASLASLLALAKERAPDPSVFDDAEPYFFTGIVSTLAVDSYFTHMHPTSLQNFAADMEQGVPLQDSHSTRRLGLGHSLTGRCIRGKGENPTRTEGEFMMLPNSTISGINTDEVMRGIRAGSVSDLSVGMASGTWICDICGGNLMSFSECPHWPGKEYTPEGKDTPVVATATIHDARLAEVSVVYSGSTPGAVIQKVIRAVEAGELEPEKVRALEACYRVSLPGSRHLWAAPSLPPAVTSGTASVTFNTPAATATAARSKETSMPDKPNAEPPVGDVGVLSQWRANIVQALTDIGQAEDGKEPVTIIREMGRKITELAPLSDRVTELDAKVKELEPLAADGTAYRTAMVDKTWSEYVRAGLADGVVEEEQKALWRSVPLAQVLKEQASYTKLGDVRCPGGRVTSEGEPETPTNGRRSELPAEAYMTRR